MSYDQSPVAKVPGLPRPIANWIIGGFLLGGALTAVVWAIVVAVGNSNSLTIVTEQALDEAEIRWKQYGPPSYKLAVELSGARRGEIHVEVQEGVVTAMTIDGRTPSQRRTWDIWAVPGQFDMIWDDLQNAKDPQKAFGVPDSGQVTLRAEFDAHYGYPKEYERITSGGVGEIRWKVVEFEGRAVAGTLRRAVRCL